MDYVGLMTLIHPAILCLVTGTAMLVAGMSWFILCRFFKKTWMKSLSVVLCFVVSWVIFCLVIYFKFDLLPIYFEGISTLD